MEQSLKFLYERLKEPHFSKPEVEGKVCQEIFLAKLGDFEPLNQHVVFKGGIILNALTHGKRGYTKDIDFDLIKYPLSMDGLMGFVHELNTASSFSNIRIAMEGVPQELRQKNYQGKRVILSFSDGIDHFFLTVDIGVYKRLIVEPKPFEYEIVFGGKKKILVNANEQMISEKLSTFAIYGTDNTRYKDFFDAYWLLTHVSFRKETVLKMFWKMMQRGGYYKTLDLALSHTIGTFMDTKYLSEIQKTGNNWTTATITEISLFLCHFLQEIKEK
jgi:hypothetical protein